MFKEGNPIRRPSPEGETTLSVERQPLPVQENLAIQMLQVLERIPETGKTYSFKEAAELLNQRAKDMEIKARVSRETLRKWTLVALGKIIEPIADLSREELTAEVFETQFPDENLLSLSPRSLFAFRGRGWYRCDLSINDLNNILFCAQEAYKKGLQQQFLSAREVIQKFQDECFSPQEIAMIFKDRRFFSRYAYFYFAKKLDQLILSGALPLDNYPTILARTVGIPKEFFLQELKKEWQEVLFQLEKPISSHLLRRYPERFTSLTNLLTPFLEEKGIKLRTRYVHLLALYLEEKDIEIIFYESVGGTYHILSCEEQEKIEGLFENEETRKELEQIAREGFTLEEYLHYRPPKVALTEVVRLAGGLRGLTAPKRLEGVKKVLRRQGIPFEEKPVARGKYESVLTHLPIEKLNEAVAVLQKASEANPTLF